MKKEQKLIFRLLPLLIAAVIAALLPQMIRNEYYIGKFDFLYIGEKV